MRMDLTVAGIDPQAFVQVRLAAHLLAAQQMRVVVREWDGTRCDLLVADVDDAYGRSAIALADRRKTPVLVLGAQDANEPRRVLARDSAALMMAQVMRALLPARQDAQAAAPVCAATLAGIPPTIDFSNKSTALLRLANEDALRGRDVRATVAGRTISLNPSAGRATAASLADLLAARDQLGTTQWQLRPQAQGANSADVSISLDAFYVCGALRVSNELPPFPTGRYRLRDWPDLGAAPVLVGALRVAHALTRAWFTPEALAEKLHMAMSEIHACLWAFRASGLLLVDDAAANEPAPAPREVAPERAPERANVSLLSKIAQRFGMGRLVAQATG